MKMKFIVTPADGHPHQYKIENNHAYLEGDFNDVYVRLDGYFGNLNPHTFAAAPMLLDALRDMVKMNPGTATQAALDAINEATK